MRCLLYGNSFLYFVKYFNLLNIRLTGRPAFSGKTYNTIVK